MTMRADHDPNACLWCQFKVGVLQGVEEMWMVLGALGLFVSNSVAEGWRAIAGAARDYLEQQERERLWREIDRAREVKVLDPPERLTWRPWPSEWVWNLYHDPDTAPLGDPEPDDWRATDTGEPTRRI